MGLFLSVLQFSSIPSIAEEGLSLKDYIERIYSENQKISDKLDTEVVNMQKQINENDRRILRLEIYLWLIGIIAGGLGSIVGGVILKLINRRINGCNRRVPMEQVDWNKTRNGEVKKK